MNTELQIGNDPATWYLPSAGYDTVVAALAQPGDPFAIGVIAPLQGQLLLNPVAAGALSVAQPVRPVGWNPSGAFLSQSPLLYVSSAAGLTHDDPGYMLARGYQLDVLEQEILTAMAQKTFVTVSLDEGLGKGILVLSGATLPYVVICPPVAGP